MQKAFGHIQAVVSRILFIGLSIQVLFGLLWMCCSFNDVQRFEAASYYIKVSDSLLCDEYTGILYPFILMCVRSVAKLPDVPYAPVMYLLQIAFAVTAGYYFVESVGMKKRFWKLWGSLVLLTFPMTMQCHMAVLPNSMANSCFLLLLGCIIRAAGSIKEAEYIVATASIDKVGTVETVGAVRRPSEAFKYVWMYMFWLLASVLMPEYLYLGALPVVIFLVYMLVKCVGRHTACEQKQAIRRNMLCNLAMMVAFVGMIVGINALTQQPGSQGRVHNSVEAAWFRRTAWSSLAPYYPDWPQEVKDAVSEEALAATTKAPENMALLLQPQIETVLGVETAREWFAGFGNMTFSRNYPQIIREMIIDTLGYLFPTVINEILLDGRGYSSFCMRNYESMRQYHPVLTGYYMNYSTWWFPVGLALAATMQIRRRFNGFAVFTCVASAGTMVLWYMIQDAGLWDYKKALLIGSLWMIWMVKGAYAISEEN